MKVNRAKTNIDITFYLSASLLCGTLAQQFQTILAQLLPEWSSGFHLWRSGEPRFPIDVNRQDGIQDVMLTKGIAKGELFRRLERLAPVSNPERRLGSMELRGAYPGITVVLGFDDWLFCPMGTAWIAGNRIEIQVRNKRIEQSSAPDWVEKCFSLCCAQLDPFFGFACATEEYTAKNMFTESGRGLRAIGIDIAKHLPGLYWLNFFGFPYSKSMGKKCLATAVAHLVASCGSGYLVQLASEPQEWNSRTYWACEQSVRRHLGEEYFFIRDRQHRNTVSPFDLPKLSPAGKIEADVELQSGNSVVTQIRLKVGSE
jgi:hypothetical protein